MATTADKHLEARLGRVAIRPVARADVAFTTGAIVLFLATGVALAKGGAAPVAIAVAAFTAVGAAVVSWRHSLLGLLVYLPVSGLLIVALYPDTAPGVLAKDVLFVIPAYVGFAVHWLAQRHRLAVPGVPLLPLAALVVLVLVQMLNPAVPGALVALIGAKTWLLYIPLVLLGFELVRDRADLDRVLMVMVLAAVAPCVIGIVEAVLIYTGHASTVHGWYGQAASAVTQGFAEITTGTSQVRRVPSTFSFAAQYYSFTIAAVAIAYASWRGVLSARGHGVLGAGLLALAVVAALLSGARGAFAFVPLLLLIMVALDSAPGGRVRRASVVALVATACLVAASSLLGSSLRPLLGDVASHGFAQLDLALVQGLRHAVDVTILGIGTGMDTVAARYAVPDDQLFQAIGGTWQESWWVKAILELGVAGLIAVVALLGTIAVRAVRSTARLNDAGLRAVSAALTAYVLWGLLIGFKAQYLDLDPMNIYFWLFLGILARLPFLERASP
jgi:hypothetical protein